MMFTLQPKRAYIIIDALDECNDHSEWSRLIELLQKVCYWNLQNVRLLCTSRQEKSIVDGLSGFSLGINLESSIVDADICHYVDTVLTSDKWFARWQNHEYEKDQIKTTLKTQANGM